MDHSGIINVSEAWNSAQNPHVVTAPITVNGCTLTIGAGCVVYFEDDGVINDRDNKIATINDGEGVIAGTATNPVLVMKKPANAAFPFADQNGRSFIGFSGSWTGTYFGLIGGYGGGFGDIDTEADLSNACVTCCDPVLYMYGSSSLSNVYIHHHGDNGVARLMVKDDAVNFNGQRIEITCGSAITGRAETTLPSEVNITDVLWKLFPKTWTIDFRGPLTTGVDNGTTTVERNYFLMAGGGRWGYDSDGVGEVVISESMFYGYNFTVADFAQFRTEYCDFLGVWRWGGDDEIGVRGVGNTNWTSVGDYIAGCGNVGGEGEEDAGKYNSLRKYDSSTGADSTESIPQFSNFDVGGSGGRSAPATNSNIELTVESVIVTPTTDSCTISFATPNRDSTARVEYGLLPGTYNVRTPEFGRSYSDWAGGSNDRMRRGVSDSHEITLRDLFGGTSYYYRIVATDVFGNQETTTGSFRTDGTSGETYYQISKEARSAVTASLGRG